MASASDIWSKPQSFEAFKALVVTRKNSPNISHCLPHSKLNRNVHREVAPNDCLAPHKSAQRTSATRHNTVERNRQQLALPEASAAFPDSSHDKLHATLYPPKVTTPLASWGPRPYSNLRKEWANVIPPWQGWDETNDHDNPISSWTRAEYLQESAEARLQLYQGDDEQGCRPSQSEHSPWYRKPVNEETKDAWGQNHGDPGWGTDWRIGKWAENQNDGWQDDQDPNGWISGNTGKPADVDKAYDRWGPKHNHESNCADNRNDFTFSRESKRQARNGWNTERTSSVEHTVPDQANEHRNKLVKDNKDLRAPAWYFKTPPAWWRHNYMPVADFVPMDLQETLIRWNDSVDDLADPRAPPTWPEKGDFQFHFTLDPERPLSPGRRKREPRQQDW